MSRQVEGETTMKTWDAQVGPGATPRGEDIIDLARAILGNLVNLIVLWN